MKLGFHDVQYLTAFGRRSARVLRTIDLAPPVRNMIIDDLRCGVHGEVPANRFDEIALRIFGTLSVYLPPEDRNATLDSPIK